MEGTTPEIFKISINHICTGANPNFNISPKLNKYTNKSNWGNSKIDTNKALDPKLWTKKYFIETSPSGSLNNITPINISKLTSSLSQELIKELDAPPNTTLRNKPDHINILNIGLIEKVADNRQ
jgi:hypothetical protein